MKFEEWYLIFKIKLNAEHNYKSFSWPKCWTNFSVCECSALPGEAQCTTTALASIKINICHNSGSQNMDQRRPWRIIT